MPLLQTDSIARGHGVALWKITEQEEQLLDRLKGAGLASSPPGSIRPPMKRLQWLACRLLAASLTGLTPVIAYDHYGKPLLRGFPGQISFSHSGALAAAMAGAAPVGVDVQVMVDTVERIAKKFLGSDELDHVPDDPGRVPYLHVLWGAKEAMYKAHGKKRLSFARDLHISPFTLADSGIVRGRMVAEGIETVFDIRYRKVEDAMLVYLANG